MTILRRLFEIDYRSLAVFRIGLAITSLYALYVIAPDLEAFYTDAGLTALGSTDDPHRKGFGFTVFALGGGWPLVAAVWAVGVLVSLALLIGWRARLAAALLWVIWLSFTSRNAFLVQGGDRLLVLLLFWAVFLPISAKWAVDGPVSRLKIERGDAAFSIATVGLLLQVLYVYVFGALLKTADTWVANGSAIFIALHLDTFATDLGIWFRQYVVPMMLLTFFVFYLELLAPVLLYFPDRRLLVRKITLALLMAMHVGFRVFLHIGHFWMVSLTSLTSYIPSGWWDWLERRFWSEEQRRIEIWYDRDCGFCLRTALVLKEFFLPSEVSVRPAQDHPEIGPLLEREVSWVVVDGDGRRLLHWDAVAFVMRQNLLLRPLGWLAALYGAVGLGRPTYDLIGRNRRKLGKATNATGASSGFDGRLPRPLSALLAVVVVFCFLLNMQPHVPALAPAFGNAQTQAITKRAGFWQSWTMFAPSPPLVDGYPIVVALTPEPQTVNLFPRPPEPFDRAERISDQFPSHRWRKYLNNLRIADEDTRRLYLARYAAYACDLARQEHGEGVEGVRITLAMNQTEGTGPGRDFTTEWGDWPCGE